MGQISSGRFSLGCEKANREFNELIDKLQNNGSGFNGDNYLVCHDFPSFCDAQERADREFQNKARCANAPLAEVISKWMGNDLWIKDLSKMSGLLQSKGNQKLKEEWAMCKLMAKERLAAKIKKLFGVDLETDALFDVQ